MKAYGRMEFPYAQSIEDLRYRQISSQVDINVVFPFSPDLHFSLTDLIKNGEIKKSDVPLSPVPYGTENTLLMREIFEYCPELSDHFIPFVSVDPGREIDEQMQNLSHLNEEYPIYGLKIVGVACQSKVTNLLSESSVFLDFAEGNNIPILFHTTSTKDDEYSYAADVLTVAQKRPGIRCCLAHCILFHKNFLNIANALPNVWVDTAAIKIQIDLVQDCINNGMQKQDIIDTNFSDYRQVMRDICQMYPDTILWGTDSPAYTYYSLRKQGASNYRTFAYKGTYEDEVNALRSLPTNLQKKVGGKNTLDFLFGKKK